MESKDLIVIVGGAKTGYNLHQLLHKNCINSVYYYYKGEFGEKKAGGKFIDLMDDNIINDGILIVTSETAFFHLNNRLKSKLASHYFLRDKTNYPEIAKKIGVNTIKEYTPETNVYPAFAKPRQSGEGKVPFKTKLIQNNNELHKIKQHIKYCTIQEYLAPNEYQQISVAGYFTGIANSFISVKQLNQYPIGISSYVSYHTNEQTETIKKNLSDYLNALPFRGFIEVEFKQNKNTGSVVLMDINPRPWGWFYYYASAVKNLERVIKYDDHPVVDIKKSWVNLPRLVLSNLKGRFYNPPVKDVLMNKICYEPYF